MSVLLLAGKDHGNFLYAYLQEALRGSARFTSVCCDSGDTHSQSPPLPANEGMQSYSLTQPAQCGHIHTLKSYSPQYQGGHMKTFTRTRSAATGWKPARDPSINVAAQAVAFQSQYQRAGASTDTATLSNTKLRYKANTER